MRALRISGKTVWDQRCSPDSTSGMVRLTLGLAIRYGVAVIGALSSPFSPHDFAARASSSTGSRPTKMVATAQMAQAMRAKKKHLD